MLWMVNNKLVCNVFKIEVVYFFLCFLLRDLILEIILNGDVIELSFVVCDFGVLFDYYLKMLICVNDFCRIVILVLKCISCICRYFNLVCCE